jgi:hypothetical protein
MIDNDGVVGGCRVVAHDVAVQLRAGLLMYVIAFLDELR